MTRVIDENQDCYQEKVQLCNVFESKIVFFLTYSVSGFSIDASH